MFMIYVMDEVSIFMSFSFEGKTSQIGDYGLWKCQVSNQGFCYSDGGAEVKILSMLMEALWRLPSRFLGKNEKV